MEAFPESAPWHLLYPRERLIVRRRDAGATYRALARELDVTAERVRQIDRLARRVLSGKHPHDVRQQWYIADSAAFLSDWKLGDSPRSRTHIP